MRSQDKGLVLYQGKPLIEYAIDSLRPQVDTILINCNRNQSVYRRYGFNLVEDRPRDNAGPLRGILSAIPQIATPYTLVVPCDMPFLPTDLVNQLMWHESEYQISCFHDGERLQSLVFIAKTEILSSIAGEFASNDESNKNDTAKYGSVKSWLVNHSLKVNPADTASYPRLFTNINTLENNQNP